MSRYPANRIVPFGMLVPLIGLTAGWLAFGESLRPVRFVGASLQIAGLPVNLVGAPLFARLQMKTVG